MFYVFDLDGTLSDPSFRNLRYACPQRGAPHLRADIDWASYHCDAWLDAPNRHVIDILKSLEDHHNRIEIWTARGEIARAITVAWLATHEVPYDLLRMRPADDFRPDEELKLGWMAEGGRPDVVFEDRDRVVAAWRRAGIPCFQVAPGNF